MQAQMALNDKQIEKANTTIIKAQDIVTEFRGTLDRNYEIAEIGFVIRLYVQAAFRSKYKGCFNY